MASRGWNRTTKVDRVAATMSQPRTDTENSRARAFLVDPREVERATSHDAAAQRGEEQSTPAVIEGVGRFREMAGHGPLVLAGLAVAIAGSTPLAEAWFVACRSAYVFLVGYWLHVQSKHGALTRKHGHDAWPRFRARAARLMVADSIAFGALCVVTRGTLALPVSRWLALLAGVLLVGIGVGTKAWATATLPRGAFYWRDFFVPAQHRTRIVSGPYRWISNPMYTVGYAHAYGFAVLLDSGPGLAGAVLAQLAMLALAALVERPHFRAIDPG
jgi:protein-S-isoprenylcysteine O-methyltransferase Ste14